MTEFTELAAQMQAVLAMGPDERSSYLGSLPPELANRVRELLQFEGATLDLSRIDGVAIALDVLSEPVPESIGRWTVVQPLGYGGMASVFLVERSERMLRQSAACKIGYAQADLEEGLRRETATLLHLGHPGIAKVLDFGHTEAGRPWMVSELVEGSDIVSHADGNFLSLEARLALFEDVLSAVAHAHERLLLHQDIKPENILVDGAGRPRLIDFGLATMLSGQGDAPVLGYTPRFASPEQKRGQPLTIRSDLYSLGVTLRALVQAVAPAPTHDVWAVIDKACEEDPQRRFASASAMAADLRAICARRPVSARSPRMGYRLGLFLRRNPWPFTFASLIMLAVVLGLFAYLQQTREAIAAGERAEVERQRAVATTTFLTNLFGSVVPNSGGRVELRLSEFLEPAFERLKQDVDLADGAKVDIAAALGTAYGAIGDAERADEVRAYGIELAQASRDLRSQARLLTDGADMHISRQDIASATSMYDRAIAIEHDDPELRGRAQFSRMSAAFMHEDWNEVLQLAHRLAAEIDAGRVPGEKMRAGVAYSEATALMRLGRHDEAEAAALRAQAAYVERLGEDSGPVANVLDVRTQIAMAANRHDHAEQLALDAQRVAAHAFGTNHARYSEILSNHGLLRQTQGRTHEAMQIYRQAHEIAQAANAPGPRTALLQMNLGSTLSMLDDDASRSEGLMHLQQSTSTLASTLGDDHPMALKSAGLLAGAEALAGDVASAVLRLEKATASFEATGARSFDYADLLASHATVLLQDRQYAACVQRLDQALDILQHVYASDHWYFDMYGAYRALCQFRLGDAEAAARFESLAVRLEAKLPADSGELATLRKLQRSLEQDPPAP